MAELQQSNQHKIDAYWQQARQELGLDSRVKQPNAWGFGNSPEMADQLARLVLDGIKTATASSKEAYELAGDPYPVLGQYDIVLNGQGEPVAVIQNVMLAIQCMNEVSEEHAFLEGEGDRTLAYWRKAHERFFKQCAEQDGVPYREDMPLILERFKVVYC